MTIALSQNRAHTQVFNALAEEILAHNSNGLCKEDLTRWREDLQTRLQRVQQHPEQNMGFIEENIRQSALELQRLLVQKAMQDKADAVDEKCPDCQHTLRNKKRRVEKVVDAYCGKVKLQRTHGWCPDCDKWSFPADRVLGLRDDSNASPLVQELCALLVSKMPAEQAEALSLRVIGRSLSRSTLARQAQYQGDEAIALRQQLVNKPIVQTSTLKAALGVDSCRPNPLPWSSRSTPGISGSAITGARPNPCAGVKRS